MSVAEIDAELTEYVNELASRWWWFLGFGAVSTLFGLWLLFWHDWDEESVVTFFGIFLVVWGALRLLAGFLWHGDGKWALMATGLVGVGLGIATFAWPDPTLKVIAGLVALWLMVSGALNIIGGLFQKREPRWLLVLWGGLALALGIWAWNHEVATLFTVIFAMGLGFLLSGIMEIVAAFQIKGLPDEYEKAKTETYDKMNTLADLHAKGVLTDEEYAREKAKLLIG
jgi:uncharacterized membrane protein HdeD (DUF308 family)